MPSLEAALVGIGLVVIILSSGITYGWTALCVVLDREKELYYYLPKAERTSKRELIMTVAMMCVNIGGISFGALLDYAGPVVTNIVAGVGFLLSCFVFGYGFDYLVGYGLMGFCGAGMLAAGFRLGPTFPSHTAIVMTAVTCMFDSSTIVFMVFDGINAKFGVNVKQFFTGLAILVGVLHTIFVFLWIQFQKKLAAREAEAEAMLDLGEEAGMMPLEVGKDTDLLLPGQQRRFSDASDYDINFKPTPKGAMLVDSSLNSETMRMIGVRSNLERRGSHISGAGRSVRSSASRASQSSHASRRSTMARSTISCIEEALALPPEERALNEVVGVNDPETALHTSAAINSSYGLADSYPHHSQDGTTGLKLAQVLLEESFESGGTGDSEAVKLKPAEPAPVKLIDMSFVEQLKSKEWRFVISMSLITIYRTQWYMSATQPYLNSIGDDNTYAQITGMILPFEAAFVPVTMWVLQRKGLWVGAMTAVCIGAVHCVLETIPVLPLQVVVAVCMTTYRSMAFSVVNTFIVKVFGVRNVGRHAGTLRGLSGIIVLTQFPLMSLIQNQLHGDFLYEHIAACALMFALLGMALWLRKVSKQEVIFRGS